MLATSKSSPDRVPVASTTLLGGHAGAPAGGEDGDDQCCRCRRLHGLLDRRLAFDVVRAVFLIGDLPSMLCCRDRLKLHPDLRGRAAAHVRGVRVEVEVQKEITTLISVDVQKGN